VPAVTETFFAVEVTDMPRVIAFYTAAFEATVLFRTDRWTSLRIAGVRVGLSLAEPAQRKIGLHFAVGDLTAACRAIGAAGGRVLEPLLEPTPGVTLAYVADTEGNAFTLTRAG
jgi:predicted enzyme related to lactoylglutathione lyase